jgi:hypothetical protein
MSSPLPPNQEYVRREIIAAALATRAESTGGYLRWSELAEFPLPDGTMERLVDPGRGGIWNPRGYAATLTIVTSPDGPYPDGGLLQYSYQKGPEGGKNLKLRAAMELGLPVIRLNKIGANAYNPIYPVFVVERSTRSFGSSPSPLTRCFVASRWDRASALSRRPTRHASCSKEFTNPRFGRR